MAEQRTIEQQACVNTDREIWRRDGGEACDPDNYYQPSIHVTKEGAIGINVGGYVYVKPVEEWHKLAGGKFPAVPEPLSSNHMVDLLRETSEGKHPLAGHLVWNAADWIDRASALLPLIPREQGSALASEVSELLRLCPVRPAHETPAAPGGVQQMLAVKKMADKLSPYECEHGIAAFGHCEICDSK